MFQSSAPGVCTTAGGVSWQYVPSCKGLGAYLTGKRLFFGICENRLVRRKVAEHDKDKKSIGRSKRAVSGLRKIKSMGFWLGSSRVRRWRWRCSRRANGLLQYSHTSDLRADATRFFLTRPDAERPGSILCFVASSTSSTTSFVDVFFLWRFLSSSAASGWLMAERRTAPFE